MKAKLKKLIGWSKLHPNFSKQALLIIFSAIMCTVMAFGIHFYAEANFNAEAVDISLDIETRDEYIEQIQEFLGYETMDKMFYVGATEKYEEITITIFDGYSNNLFLFSDDTLVAYGTNLTGQFIRVEQ